MRKKVRRYILIIVMVTAAPSVYLAYRIVDHSIFENNAQAFIDKEINFANTQVITRNFRYSNTKGNEIDLLLLGEELNNAQIDSLRKKMSGYKLDKARLTIRQGLNAKNELDLSQIKASILEAVYKNDSTAKKASNLKGLMLPIPDLTNELKTLYPDLVSFSIHNTSFNRLDTNAKDTMTLAVVSFGTKVSVSEQTRLQQWLKSRINADSLKLIVTE
jgi:hypothetical protein